VTLGLAVGLQQGGGGPGAHGHSHAPSNKSEEPDPETDVDMSFSFSLVHARGRDEFVPVWEDKEGTLATGQSNDEISHPHPCPPLSWGFHASCPNALPTFNIVSAGVALAGR
jgi:hypothetical protein